MSEKPRDTGILFPIEVWTEIFQYLRILGPKPLAAACLISPALRYEGQALLCKTVDMHSSQSGKSFAEIALRYPHIASAVQELNIKCGYQRNNAYQICLKNLCQAVIRLSGLHTLGFYQFGAIAILKGRVVPTLRRLRGHDLEMDEAMVDVLRKHPLLEEVRITHTRFNPEVRNFDTLELPRLRILSCSAFNLYGEHLTFGNVTHLTITFWRVRVGADLPFVCATFGPRLVSFRMTYVMGPSPQSREAPDIYAFDWSGFPRLKYLEIIRTFPSHFIPPRIMPIIPSATDAQHETTYSWRTNLPPALTTLVWSNIGRFQGLLNEYEELMGENSELAPFRVILETFPTLREIICFINVPGGGFHYSMTAVGEVVRRRATAEEMDADRWTEV